MALRGTEVKSIREGKANLKDAYGLLKDGECFLLNAHIGPFSHGNAMNHDSLRTRKLLLHRIEVRKLESMTRQKGFTLIPTRLYFRNGRVKCELALAKGKQEWDKRAAERKREGDNEARPRPRLPAASGGLVGDAAGAEISAVGGGACETTSWAVAAWSAVTWGGATEGADAGSRRQCQA